MRSASNGLFSDLFITQYLALNIVSELLGCTLGELPKYDTVISALLCAEKFIETLVSVNSTKPLDSVCEFVSPIKKGIAESFQFVSFIFCKNPP